MRIRARHHGAPAGKINVTPLIDVVMVLIVFYLIVGKLASDRGARVDLPRTNGATMQSGAGVVITVVNEAGALRIYVDNQETPQNLLADAVRARMPELSSGTQATTLSLRADRSLPYSSVAPVIDACREAGVANLRLVSTGGGA